MELKEKANVRRIEIKYNVMKTAFTSKFGSLNQTLVP
jgi:hypothetical protein